MVNIKNLKVFAPFILGFITLLLISSFSQDWFYNLSPKLIEARNLYRTAREFQSKNDYKSAYYAYNKISSRYSIYDIVLFQKSKCAAALGDEKNAISSLKLLLSKYPKTIVADQVNYSLGQAYIRIKDYKNAEKLFLRTIKLYPSSNYAYGSYYYLGQINKTKNKALARNYRLKYIKTVPDGRFTAECLNDIKLAGVNLSTNDKKYIAIALIASGKYKEAVKYLEQMPVSQSWYYLSECYEAINANEKALKILTEGLQKYSDTAAPEQIKQAMSTYVKLNSASEPDNWSYLAGISRKARDFALFSKAQLIPTAQTENIYYEIVNKYPQGDYASESLWNIFWLKFNNGSYEQAIKLGEMHLAKFNNTKASPKILFWTGKAFERINQKNTAENYYKKLLTQYSDSYYAFRANGRLGELQNGNDPGWKTGNLLAIHESSVPMPYSYEEIRKKHGTHIAELIQVKDYQTALELMKEDSFLESWLKLRDGMILKSMITARDAMSELIPKPAHEDSKWKLIYPVYFADNINIYAKAWNLDPALVLALIKEESHFNPFAVSSSNARGLMQLLPGTARDVARWNNFEQPDDVQLFNPEINIKFGAAYLSYIKQKTENSSLLAVAGYNGGPKAVENWLSIIPHNDMDQFIENIPYDQTKNYVKKVFASYWNYKRIYGF